jgi:hypothetical protein
MKMRRKISKSLKGLRQVHGKKGVVRDFSRAAKVHVRWAKAEMGLAAKPGAGGRF